MTQSDNTFKLAVYKDTTYGFNTVAESALDDSKEYARITEYQEVKFTLLPQNQIVNHQISALREQKKTLQVETEQQLTLLDEQIQTLLALPAPPANPPSGDSQ